jgi:S-adenosylhomocysteine hydrolase
MNECDITDDKRAVLSKCNVIFLATGNGSISRSDLDLLQHDTILACCTSADKEIKDFESFSDIPHKDLIHKGSLANRAFKIGDKTINLLMNGKSVNFWAGTGSAHPALYLALGSWIAHAAHLINDEDRLLAKIQARRLESKPNEVMELDKASILEVIKSWERHYGDIVPYNAQGRSGYAATTNGVR